MPLLALGANVSGAWGAPRDSLAQACLELEKAGLKVIRSSNLYLTDPVGVGRQSRYLNAVIIVEPGFAPGALLRLLKRLERQAGRKLAPRMYARPLDIDIL